jgi:hypothetical protein
MKGGLIKMQKPKVDERAVEIAVARLVREVQQKSLIAPHWYLVGYHAAISDFVWDYTRNPLVSLEWDQYMQEQVEKGNVKIGVISLKDIKLNSKEK